MDIEYWVGFRIFGLASGHVSIQLVVKWNNFDQKLNVLALG